MFISYFFDFFLGFDLNKDFPQALSIRVDMNKIKLNMIM